MSKSISRRDFLKLAGLAPLGLAAPRFLQTASNQKNVVIIVFDALSASNISLYGYSRETMPNLAKLAERATVYNKHYAGGSYTTTGTASLLTGTNPWTHRAFQLSSGVGESVATHNIFNVFKNYYRLAYTHNFLANILLRQFKNDIDEWIPREKLLLGSYGNFVQSLFGNDQDIASISWMRAMRTQETGYAYSLFLSRLYQPLQENNYRAASLQFPRGIPSANQDDGFILGEAVDWISSRLGAIPQPFLGYFHFLPPHAPYRTHAEFFKRFDKDDYEAPEKPVSIFNQKQDRLDLLRKRTEYDEFILYADKEFGRFYDQMESSGLLENTIIVLTSDHGELNERGISGHSTSALYDPGIRVPLMIFNPGQKERVDIHDTTSAVDLLPTLMHLTGQTPPDWIEGNTLPPFNSAAPDPDKKIYVIRAIKTEQDQPMTNLISVALVKGRYKIHYYAGYPEVKKMGAEELVNLFDIEADPEELVDLADTHKDIADEMLKELKAKLAQVNMPYS